MDSAATIVAESGAITRTERLAEWSKRLTKFLSLQLVIQGLGFLVGILIIRKFSKEEYAWYTLAIAAQGVMMTLADLGLGTALLALGGKAWRSAGEMGGLLATALRLRRKLFFGTVLLAGSVSLWLFARAEGEVWFSLLVIAVVAIGVLAQLDSSLYCAVLRLNSRIQSVQSIELRGAVLRLSLVATCLLFVENTLLIVAVAALSAIVSRELAKRAVAAYAEPAAQTHSRHRADLLKLVRQQAPNALFYCFYGQAAIILISLFGDASKIAEVGALSRLSLALLLVSSVLANFVYPAFARGQDAGVLSRRYHQTLFLFASGGALMVLLAWFFPHAVLALLGHQYANLESETGWMVLSAVLNALAATMFGFCASKGWTKGIWVTIPSILSGQILALFLVDLSTVKGVLMFGTFPILPAVAIYYFLARNGIKEASARV